MTHSRNTDQDIVATEIDALEVVGDAQLDAVDAGYRMIRMTNLHGGQSPAGLSPAAIWRGQG